MSDYSPLQMADLLPLPPAPASPYWPWLLAPAVLLLAGIGLWWWRRHRDPYRRIAAALRRGTLAPRAAAHALAALDITAAQRSRLDRLRFTRQAPSVQQLAQLLRELRDGR